MATWAPSSNYESWPGCRDCRHYRQEDGTCVAYPDLIPILIGSGQVDHLMLRPGQVGGTLFEPKEETDDETE